MITNKNIILSIYDHSGIWSDPWKQAGYEVIRFDYQNDGLDVRLLEYNHSWNKRIYGILAAPPCTKFAGSGARWRKVEKGLPSINGFHTNKYDEIIQDSLSLVDLVFRMRHLYNPEFWTIENPIGSLRRWIGKPLMSFNPNEYAGWLEDPDLCYNESYTKRTLLWGHFSPPQKKSVDPVQGSKMHKNYGGKSEKTKNARSITPMGFARAFYEANK
jgi:hypothetical protein